jgi:hypothetical protein
MTESGLLPPNFRERRMCEKCVELEKVISQHLRMLRQGFDPLTIERINEAVADMERQKETLHCGAAR